MTPSARLSGGSGLGHCKTTSWTSGTALVCMTGIGSGAARAMITLSKLVGTAASMYTYDPTACTSGDGITAGTIVCDAVGGTVAGMVPGCTCTCNSGFHGSDCASAYRLTAIAPVNAPVSGGGPITISGWALGAVDHGATMFLGSTHCATTSWRSFTAILCQTPAGIATVQSPSEYRRWGIPYAYLGGGMFTYEAPIVSSATGNAPISAAHTSVVVIGLNFGCAHSVPVPLILDSTVFVKLEC